MTPPAANTALKKYADEAATLIFIADQTVSIHGAIREGREGVLANNLGELFGVLWSATTIRALLAFTKLFERSKKYPLWNIPALLDHIENNAGSLQVTNRDRILGFLSGEGAEQVRPDLEDKDFTLALVRVLRDSLPDKDRASLQDHDVVMKALLQQRDKVIAHNEAVDRETLGVPEWDGLVELLTLAKQHLSAIGWAFLNSAYTDDEGDYMLTSDAGRTGVGMRRLLTKAGLRPAGRIPGVI